MYIVIICTVKTRSFAQFPVDPLSYSPISIFYTPFDLIFYIHLLWVTVSSLFPNRRVCNYDSWSEKRHLNFSLINDGLSVEFNFSVRIRNRKRIKKKMVSICCLGQQCWDGDCWKRREVKVGRKRMGKEQKAIKKRKKKRKK